MRIPRAPLILLALCALACGKAPAPETSPSAAPAPASGPAAIVVNRTGEEVRDVWVGVPGGPAAQGSPIKALKAGESVRLALPQGASKVSVQFMMKPDRRFEKTVPLLGETATLTLRPGGAVSAGLGSLP